MPNTIPSSGPGPVQPQGSMDRQNPEPGPGSPLAADRAEVACQEEPAEPADPAPLPAAGAAGTAGAAGPVGPAEVACAGSSVQLMMAGGHSQGSRSRMEGLLGHTLRAVDEPARPTACCQCCAMSGGNSAWDERLSASRQSQAREGSARSGPSEPKRGVPWHPTKRMASTACNLVRLAAMARSWHLKGYERRHAI